MTTYSKYGSSSRLAHLPTAERRGAECLRRNAYRLSTGCAAPSMTLRVRPIPITTSIPTRCPRLISAWRFPTEIEWNLEAKHCLGTGAAVASIGGHCKARPGGRGAERPARLTTERGRARQLGPAASSKTARADTFAMPNHRVMSIAAVQRHLAVGRHDPARGRRGPQCARGPDAARR